jgi:UDP-N-acetylglucosamine 2-epimerase (non-hydrolysing)
MHKLKIINVVGTRPNFIKVAPLCRAFEKYADTVQHLLCHTGQHSDAMMSDVFFKELGMPVPDFYLGINNGTHGEITGRIIIEFEKILMTEKPDLVIVVGDVNSTMACAVAAVKLGIKTAHVESGLRSGDRGMPEEINRLLTDAIADYLFVTEKSGLENLAREGVAAEKIFMTGNVMIDTLIYLQDKVAASGIHEDLALQKNEYILVTFHRPSNVDTHENLESLIRFLNGISGNLPVLFPIHPRTRKNINRFGLTDTILPGVKLIDPLGYIDFQSLVRHARIVVTDSGGIQEETTFLGVQCLTVRNNTERPVTMDVGTNQLCGTDLDFVAKKANEIIEGNIKHGQIPDLWDGKAAERIAEILVNKFAEQ